MYYKFSPESGRCCGCFFYSDKPPLQLMAVKIRRTAYGIRLRVFTLKSEGKNPTACKDERVLT